MTRITERVLARLRELPGLEEAPSQFTAGPAFWSGGRELVHLHGDDVEVRVTRRLVDRVLEDERVVRRARTSDWVIVSAAEQDLVVHLAREAIEVNRT
jgi:hypothetical protein